MATAIRKSKSITVRDIGPVENLVIPIPASGGVVILRGRNGRGKSECVLSGEVTMNLTCITCEADFDSPTIRGYCDACIADLQASREQVHQRQHPSPGVIATGKFAKHACPQTIFDPVREVNACGLCGSSEIQMGYGFAGGYGLGGYSFCTECNTVLDFHEDRT